MYRRAVSYHLILGTAILFAAPRRIVEQPLEKTNDEVAYDVLGREARYAIDNIDISVQDAVGDRATSGRYPR